jgi:putative inorganic carbon (hco3(-)) transporter
LGKIENKVLFYFFSLLFIAINVGFIAYDIYYIAFLPAILLFFVASFVALDKILLTIVFFTPLSIQLRDFFPGISFNLSLPTEPLLFGVLILFVFKLLLDGRIDKRIMLHPVSIAIYFYLFWMLVTSLTSTMPIVSLKYLLSKVWFIVSMYILAAHLFKDKKNIERFVWLYAIGLIIVIAYANYRLSGYGFDNQRASNWVVWPFFSDHTSYGAMLVMFLFPLYYFFIRKNPDLFLKAIIGLIFLIFIFAIVFSYTRAAWLSLFAGIGFWIIVKLKLQFRTIFIAGITIVLVAILSYSSFIQHLEKNESESSGQFSEHLESMANITTDASNLERLNRWKCALRMFNEKPFFGWGPGTYMFQYAPFQFSRDKTIISTNFGDLGNAHSEYLGPLAESGILGLVSVLLLVASVFYTGYKIYNSGKGEIRDFSLYITLGLSTYFIHGFLNNFLDSDKASVAVWGFIAILVAMDVYQSKTKEENTR